MLKKNAKKIKKSIKNRVYIKNISIFVKKIFKKMAELRFSALREVFNREPVEVTTPSKIVSEYYRRKCF